MAVIHWVGGSSTHFNDSANWNPAVVPGVSDDAIIDPVGAISIDSPTSITINSLALVATATLTINAGTTFTVNDGTSGAGITGNIVVANSAVFSIGGTIVNTGTINESSSGTTTKIVLNQTTNILQGGGQLLMSANTNNQIFGAAANFELDNVDNTISGAGNIGNGQMVLSNEGIINANQSTAALTVNTGGNVIINSGTMEATLGGDLNILSAVNNVGGTIEAVGVGSTVFLQSNVTGGSVLASGGGVIQTSGGSGVLDGLGLHPVTNGSAIQVLNGQVLTLLGTIINNSSINLNANANNTDLRIGSPIVTLLGTGGVHLTNNFNNRIFGNSGAFQLINKSNTIDGAGQLGASQLTFINNALVDANQPGALVLNTNGEPVTNTGTLQASNTGGLLIQNTAINNAGGTVQALVAGSHVDLAGSTIEGGTLKTANGGVIQTVGGNGSLDGITFGVLNNQGSIQVNDQTILSLSGTINNTGTINSDQESTSGSTQIRVASQTVTLKGGGKLTMSNNGLNEVFGNSGNNQLVNVDNTISGAGQLGAAQLTLINQSKGVINADQAAGLLVAGQLIVNTQNSILTNAGLLEATNTGGLLLQNTAIKNTGGTVLASGADVFVDLGGSTIEGGTLLTASGGTIETVSGNGGLDGITAGMLNNNASILVNSQTQLDLAGTINNTGTINENQQGNSGSTRIRVTSQQVNLQGGGKLIMSPNALNQIFGSSSSNVLVNVDNAITGAGQLGAGTTMYLVNQTKGNINADQAVALTLNTGGNLVTNTGTLQDTGTGGLVISSTAVNNAGGTIQAVGAGAHVDLQSAYIEGGIVRTASGGVIQTVDRGSALDGITAGVLNNKGSIQVIDNTSLTLVGVINNTLTGTINEASAGSNTDLRIASQVVTLQGGGKLLMSDNINNRIFGNNASFKFVNVDNTISGSGQIGTGTTMLLVNQATGIINANQKAALVINTGSDIVRNGGTMEATGTVVLNGGLTIQNTTVNNTGGTIQAVGPLAHVDLDGGYIEGGLLTTSGGALIEMVGGGGSLDGITSGVLTNKGTALVTDHSTLTLFGTINNTGVIKENATSGTGNTNIRIGGQTVALTGTGQFLMTDNTTNRVFANNGAFTLINQGNTIGGAGQFGIGQMEFTNSSGTIQGTGGNALVLDLGSGNGVNGAGATMAATGAGGVVLASGIFTNNGLVTANDGSAFTYQSGATNTNLAEGDLVGGTWQASAKGHGATLSMTGGPIVTDAAIITLRGAGSVIQAGSGSGGTSYTALEQTLNTIAAGGQLQVFSRDYSSTQNLDNKGTIWFVGGTFHTNALTVESGGLLFGGGTVDDAVANSGKLEAASGTLAATGNVTGGGTLQVDAGMALTLNGASNSAATVLDNGTLTIGAGDSLNVTGSVDAASIGAFILNNSSVLEVAVDKGTSNRMNFIGTGQLNIDAVGQFGNNVGLGTYTGPQIKTFGLGDKIDLKDFNFGGAVLDSYTAATGLLQLHSGATKATLLFQDSSLGAGSFHMADDGGGHVLLTRS